MIVFMIFKTCQSGVIHRSLNFQFLAKNIPTQAMKMFSYPLLPKKEKRTFFGAIFVSISLSFHMKSVWTWIDKSEHKSTKVTKYDDTNNFVVVLSFPMNCSNVENWFPMFPTDSSSCMSHIWHLIPLLLYSMHRIVSPIFPIVRVYPSRHYLKIKI